MSKRVEVSRCPECGKLVPIVEPVGLHLTSSPWLKVHNRKHKNTRCPGSRRAVDRPAVQTPPVSAPDSLFERIAGGAP